MRRLATPFRFVCFVRCVCFCSLCFAPPVPPLPPARPPAHPVRPVLAQQEIINRFKALLETAGPEGGRLTFDSKWDDVKETLSGQPDFEVGGCRMGNFRG